MAPSNSNDLLLACPCCGAVLTIDPALGRVISHEAPSKPTNMPDLDQAAAILQQQAARREALFKQSTENEKTKSQVLDRIFEAGLEKSKDEPISKPTRDIDL